MKREEILKANTEGFNATYYQSYHTPILQIAFDCGQKGIDLSTAKEITGYRYGQAPQSYVSFNSREQISEKGLSLAAIENEKEVGSSVWFSGEKHIYSGILLPYKGSDGENLILAYDAENWGD